MPTSGSPAPTRSDTSLRQLLPRMTSEAGVLVRKELDMAKAETKENMAVASKAGAMFSGTALAGFMALQLLSFAAAWGLATVLPAGVAFLIVGVVYLVVAAALFARGRKLASGMSLVPQQTLQAVKEDAQWLRTRLR